MKFLYGTALFAMMTMSAFAQAPGAKSINTGGSAGAYHSTFCPPLPDALSNAYFQGYTCTTSGGTLDNISRVLKNPTSIGFAQLDVYAREAVSRPDDFKKLSVIRNDLACEGLWMVTKNPDLDYGKIQALSRRIKFVLPAKTSGAQGSFDFLKSLDPEGLGRSSESNVINLQDASAVINYVASSNQGEVGFFVQFADPRNANIKMMVEKKLRIIPVLSRELLTAKVDNQEVYQPQTFDLTQGGFFSSGMQVTTACTPVSIFTGSQEAFTERNAKDDAKDLIDRVKSIPSERLLPKDDFLAKLIRTSNRLSAAALEKTLEGIDLARKTAEGAMK